MALFIYLTIIMASSIDRDDLKRSRVQNKTVVNKSHQNIDIPNRIAYKTFEMSSPTANCFTTETRQILKISAGEWPSKVRDVWLEVDVTESGGSNSVTPAPLPYWFRYISWKGQAGNSEELYKVHDDSMVFNILQLPKDRLASALTDAGFNDKYWASNVAIPLNGSRTYRLPFYGGWIDNNYLQHLSKDMWIQLYTRNAVASGSGTLNCAAIKLVIEYEALTGFDDQKHTALYRSVYSMHTYLEPQLVMTSTTLTSSTNKTIDLDAIKGKVAFLLTVVKVGSDPSNTANALADYLDVGPNALIDLQSTTGSSLYGNGTSLKGDFMLRHIWSKYVASDANQHSFMYLMPFTNDISEAYAGVKHGYFNFDVRETRLSLTPDVASVAEVHTHNLNNAANDGGYYSLSYGNGTSDGIVFNSAVGVMKSQLEDLSDIKSVGSTVTASATAATDFTITFDAQRSNRPCGGPAVRVGKTMLNSNTLADGGVAVAPEFDAVSVSTVGKRGYPQSGNAVSVYTYAYVYKTAVITPSGDISSQLD